MADRALVIGGTGMLADATRWLASEGWEITLLARRPETLAQEIGAHPVLFDWGDPEAHQLLADLSGNFALVLIWLHDDAVHLARPAEDRLAPGARVVRIHGALSADPTIHTRREPDPRPGLARQSVILGWHPGPDGERIWLSHDEISGGAIEALKNPEKRTVLAGTRAGP